MVRAYIALGANLGDAERTLRAAVASISRLSLTQPDKVSGFYKTAPQGVTTGPTAGDDYLNAVLAIDTALTAPALLAQLQQIEQAAGRERPYPNAPRILDLDLLLYGDARIESVHLTVPHPRMWQRAFVLVPLAQIAPGLVNAAQLAVVASQRIELFNGLLS